MQLNKTNNTKKIGKTKLISYLKMDEKEYEFYYLMGSLSHKLFEFILGVIALIFATINNDFHCSNISYVLKIMGIYIISETFLQSINSLCWYIYQYNITSMFKMLISRLHVIIIYVLVAFLINACIKDNSNCTTTSIFIVSIIIIIIESIMQCINIIIIIHERNTRDKDIRNAMNELYPGMYPGIQN